MTDALNESTSEAPTTRFDVFISYSHADAKIAERLSRRIRRYKTPAAIDRTTKRLRVFRDVERLTAHPQLGEALAERLEQADNLLVLCSPAAVASEYVETEIQTFIEQKGPDAVTLTVVDGTPAESFPGAIKANYEEPLYVDLRPAGGFFKSWRTFRDESLRIVAALLGVDYAELNREDERRRRRLRWTTAFVSLITVFGLGAVYVADTVSAEVWREIRLPTRYYDSSLLPVEDYAVYIQDPDVRLFRGDGAEFAAQFPPFPIALHGNNGRDFVQQTETYLRSEKDFESLNRPVATIDFQIVADDGALTGSPSDNSKVLGRGELRIHAHLTPEHPRVAFAGVLRYETVHEGSTTSTHLFPPTQMAPKNPLGFTPWPTNVFNEFDLLPLWGFLRGNVRTAWDDDPQSIGFDILNVEESFWEGNDGQWIREGITTDGDEKRRVVVGNHRLEIQEIDDEQWPDITTDPGWASYRAPERIHVDSLSVYRTRDGERVVRGDEVDAGLIAFIESTYPDAFEVFYRVTRVSSRLRESTVELARIVAARYDDISGKTDVVGSHALVRHDSQTEWRESRGLDLNGATHFLDVFVLNTDASAILLLTDREGFFVTRDRGENWTDFNHRNAAMLNGSLLRPVVTGAMDGIYVLALDPNRESPTDANNQLFRYATRSWSERLRVGLIELLQATP